LAATWRAVVVTGGMEGWWRSIGRDDEWGRSRIDVDPERIKGG